MREPIKDTYSKSPVTIIRIGFKGRTNWQPKPFYQTVDILELEGHKELSEAQIEKLKIHAATWLAESGWMLNPEDHAMLVSVIHGHKIVEVRYFLNADSRKNLHTSIFRAHADS